MADDVTFHLCLASASPRRKAILSSIGVNTLVVPADIDESQSKDELPLDYVQRLAREKATTVQRRLQLGTVATAGSVDTALPILAADTVVVLNQEVFGKPENEQDAYRMWRRLSNQTHHVYTSMALLSGDECAIATSQTKVSFCAIGPTQMAQYWRSGEPLDKAGAYAIQGHAAAWVSKIEGSYSGVVGLPLYELNQLLRSVKLNWM